MAAELAKRSATRAMTLEAAKVNEDVFLYYGNYHYMTVAGDQMNNRWPDGLDNTWSQAIPEVAEAQVTPVPVVKISYTPEFDKVLSLFRGTVSSAFNERDSPRYAVLLAIVLRHNATNYTVWKRRRDWIQSSTAFPSSVRQNWRLPAVQFASELLSGDSEAHKKAEEKQKRIRSGVITMLNRWCPSRGVDVLPNGQYCPLRALRFELDRHSHFCVKNQKNFQVFSHRKELLIWAGSQIGADGEHLFTLPPAPLPTDSEVDPSPESNLSGALPKKMVGTQDLEASLMVENMMKVTGDCINDENTADSTALTFGAFDERPICHLMLGQDSKNYHVWSYRAWYITFFPHLLGSREGFEAEVHFTSERIKEDMFNNSAWCHRFFLLRLIFDPPAVLQLERAELKLTPQVEAAVASSTKLPAELYADPSLRLQMVLDEVFNVTFSWLETEPNNESPYSHLLGCLELLRKDVAAKTSVAEGTDGEVAELSKFVQSLAELVTTNQAGPLLDLDEEGKGGALAPQLVGWLQELADTQSKVHISAFVDVLLYLSLVLQLDGRLASVVKQCNPAVDHMDSTAMAERRPSLVGTYYGRHLDTCRVIALERLLTALRVDRSNLTSSAPFPAPPPTMVTASEVALSSTLGRLATKDTIRRKYWMFKESQLRSTMNQYKNSDNVAQ